MNKKFLLLFVVMGISFVIAGMWNDVPVIGESVHKALDPTLGYLINLNYRWGFFFIIFLITLVTTILQKYGTDQVALKKIRDDQKEIADEMKQHKDNPTKLMELQKKQLESTFGTFLKTLELTMQPVIYTAIPFILLFRWFTDIFKNLGDPKILWFLGWIGTFFVLSIIFSAILRKVMKVY